MTRFKVWYECVCQKPREKEGGTHKGREGGRENGLHLKIKIDI